MARLPRGKGRFTAPLAKKKGRGETGGKKTNERHKGRYCWQLVSGYRKKTYPARKIKTSTERKIHNTDCLAHSGKTPFKEKKTVAKKTT